LLYWQVACSGLLPKSKFAFRKQILRIAIPLIIVTATTLVVFHPIGEALSPWNSPLVVDFPLAGAIAIATIGAIIFLEHTWRQSALLVVMPALLTLVYTILLTPVVNVIPLVNGLLPTGVQVDATVNGLPVNFIVAIGILAAAFLASIALGVAWRGGVWLACAVIFYIIWLTLYTTIYTNWAGFFSGIWQGMGYWIAQQEVARGNQPW
jgi:hypothetical protein